MKFVVNRSTWNRGRNPEYGWPSLLNDKGYKCCLGFLGKACGFTDEDIRNVNYPRLDQVGYPKCGSSSDGLNWYNFGNINDDDSTTDKFKEATLTEMFARIGIEVSFED